MSKHPKPGSGKPHPQPHQDGAQHNKCDVSGSIEVHGVIETKLPPHAQKEHDAAKKKKSARDDQRYVIEIVTLIFVIIYAGLTGWYAWTAHKQWVDLRRNFETDERSWVDPTVNFKVMPVDGTVTIRLANVGKSAILSTVTDAWVEILDRNTPPSLSKEPYHSVDDTGWIFPGKATDIFGQRWTQDSHVAFPPNDDERKALISGDDYMAVYGQIIYVDQFGIHWERFCYWKGFVNNGPIVNVKGCGEFNVMGDGTNKEGTNIPDWPTQEAPKK
jgi:hypothetical protein